MHVPPSPYLYLPHPSTHTLQVPFKDLQVASKMLVRALMLREKYMILSGQTFPQVTTRFLASLDGEEAFDALSAGLSKVTSLEGETTA